MMGSRALSIVSPVRFRGAVFVLAVSVVIGFLLASQFRGTVKLSERLENESEENLTRILASLNQESAALQDEIDSLEIELDTLESSTQKKSTAEQLASEQLNTLEVLAGTVPVVGPGITIRVTDSNNSVDYTHLIYTIQELRDAGAEALAVNGRRVGASSFFSQDKGQLRLDEFDLMPPYGISAIGNASTLEGGIKIPGGSLDLFESLPGVKVAVNVQQELQISALAKSPKFDSSHPVTSSP